jgi:Holliday junction resolvase RusA-like endonuclease
VTALRFTVPSKPVPKGRPRTFRQHGRTFTNTPERTRTYESHARSIAARAVQERGAWFDDCYRLAVHIRAYGARANADLDNIAKSLTDAMNGICFVDDSQIDRLTVERCSGGDPRAEIEVSVIAKVPKKRATKGRAA